jgi:hypothetical protein
VQLSPSSPTNRELGFPVFCFFTKFLPVLLGATRPAIANKGGGSAAPLYFFRFLFFFITIFLPPRLPTPTLAIKNYTYPQTCISMLAYFSAFLISYVVIPIYTLNP